MMQSVPALSIAAMAVSAAVSALLPVAALIFFMKKTKCSPKNALVGAGTFVVFALVLETALHQAVFHFFGEKLTENIVLYALYGGLAAALFEETGRFISMKLFMKKTLTRDNSLMYGVGHGGAEAILVGASSVFSNIVLSVMINLNQTGVLLSSIPEAQRDAVEQQLAALSGTGAFGFLLSGVERVSAFVLQIGLSYLVYRAVKYKKPGFFALAVALHFAVDAGAAALSKTVSPLLIESILALVAVCAGLLTYKSYRAEHREYP